MSSAIWSLVNFDQLVFTSPGRRRFHLFSEHDLQPPRRVESGCMAV
jgi:hypothetical protein